MSMTHKKKLRIILVMLIAFSYSLRGLAVETGKGDQDKIEESGVGVPEKTTSGEEKTLPSRTKSAAPAGEVMTQTLPLKEGKEEPTSLRELFKTLDYPELQVVPRASQRLKMEMVEESSNWWYIHWPIYMSALTTFALGSTAEQSLRDDLNATELKDARSAALVARVIGASWFFGTMMVVGRKPYQKGYKKLRGFPGSGRENELLRERLAEETLEQSAYNMRVLGYVSVFTNLAAAGYIGSFLNDQGRVFAGVAGLLSFLPMIFDDWYIYNYSKQLEYKKNIFSPVVSMAMAEKLNGEVDYYPKLSWMLEY